MSVQPEPLVLPPDGAEGDIWEGHPLHRVVFTPIQCVLNSTGDPLRSPVVAAYAIQWSDGTLDASGVVEPPTVSVESSSDGLTVGQARELAALILRCADVVDGWVAS